ncbi:hypothetical protein L209DRAFT_273403 [Thermothelomyces heterothallicus CBS 203.75]
MRQACLFSNYLVPGQPKYHLFPAPTPSPAPLPSPTSGQQRQLRSILKSPCPLN